MMEDKRTLLAFLVIGLILLAMPYYYELIGVSKPPPEQQPAESVEDRSSSTPAPAKRLPSSSQAPKTSPREAERRPAPVPPGLAEASAAEAFSPRQVTVTTPLQRLVFSTEGGVLISAQMAAYKRHDDTPVELLPEGGRALAVSIATEEPRSRLDLASVEFVPDREVVRIDDGDEATLRLRAVLPSGQTVEKRLQFRSDRYGIGLHITARGFGDDVIAGLQWQGGISDAERDWQVDRDALRAMVYINESLTEQSAEDEEQHLEERGVVKWAGVRNKYFLCSLAPIGVDRSWVEISSRQIAADRYRFHSDREPPDWWPQHDFSVSARLDEAGTWESLLYVGPMDYEEIIRYNVELERAMDLGFPVVREISKLLLVLFVAAYEYVPNYGCVILLFAFVVKLLVYPLTHKSYESAARMQQVQPKITALRDKYKNDSQRLSRETMKLYKEEGVNPLGGCLPLVLQMPIFIALYQTLSSTIELRQAPFMLWIDDLSRPDQLDVGGFDLHVLPITMAAAMFFQSKMTMKDPKQAALVYIMPLVMVIFMWQFSSGLVLYWTIFNVLQIGQQVLTNHLKKTSSPQPEPRQPTKARAK